MKKFKKMLSLTLAFALCLSISIPAFAASTVPAEGNSLKRIIIQDTQELSTASGIGIHVQYQFNESNNSFGSIVYQITDVPSGIIIDDTDYAYKTTPSGEPYVLFTVRFFKDYNYTKTFAETARLYQPEWTKP